MLSPTILDKLTPEHLNYLEKFHNTKLPPKNNKLYDEILTLLFYGKKGERIDKMRFYPPVSEQELTDWENENGIEIPELYKEFLRFSNGADLGGSDELHGLDGLVTNLPPGMEADEFVIYGSYIGTGAFLMFEKSTGEFYSHDHDSSEMISKRDFLYHLREWFIDKWSDETDKGRYDWTERNWYFHFMHHEGMYKGTTYITVGEFTAVIEQPLASPPSLEDVFIDPLPPAIVKIPPNLWDEPVSLRVGRHLGDCGIAFDDGGENAVYDSSLLWDRNKDTFLNLYEPMMKKLGKKIGDSVSVTVKRRRTYGDK